MNTRQLGKSQETAAAKAAISERSGRRIEKGERPSIPGERHWRGLKSNGTKSNASLYNDALL